MDGDLEPLRKRKRQGRSLIRRQSGSSEGLPARSDPGLPPGAESS